MGCCKAVLGSAGPRLAETRPPDIGDRENDITAQPGDETRYHESRHPRGGAGYEECCRSIQYAGHGARCAASRSGSDTNWMARRAIRFFHYICANMVNDTPNSTVIRVHSSAHADLISCCKNIDQHEMCAYRLSLHWISPTKFHEAIETHRSDLKSSDGHNNQQLNSASRAHVQAFGLTLSLRLVHGANQSNGAPLFDSGLGVRLISSPLGQSGSTIIR